MALVARSGFLRAVALLAAALLAGLLAACGAPVGTPSPTPWVSNTPVLRATATQTPTPLPTLTPTPTATPTVTPTPILPPVTVGTLLPEGRAVLREANLGQIHELARWGRGRADALAWSPDGARIAVATPLGVYLYDAQSLELLRYFDTQGAASRLAWSPGSDLLAVAAGGRQDQERAGGGVQVWEMGGGTLRYALSAPGMLLDLSFAPAGGSLAVVTRLEAGSRRGARAAFYDPAGGTLLREVDLPPLDPSAGDSAQAGAEAAAAAIAPDHTLLAVRETGGPVRVWRTSDAALLAELPQAAGPAGALAFSPDGLRLAVAYPDQRFNFLNENSVRVWRLGAAGMAPLLEYQLRDDGVGVPGAAGVEGAGAVPRSLAWSPDGTRLAAGFGDRVTRVWRMDAGGTWRRLVGVTLPNGLAWSPDGTHIAAGGLETFRLDDAVKTGYTNDFIPGLYDLDLSPNGDVVALAAYSQIELRSLADGTPLGVIDGMDGVINQIDYSPDGSLLAAAVADGTTRLFRAADGRYLAELGEPTAPMLAVDFSPNGRWLAAAGEDMRVRIFRVSDGRLMLNLREPYVSYELAFAPNVDQLASLTTNGMVLRAFGGEIQRVGANLQGTVGGVSLHDLTYSPGSEFLAVVGNDLIRVINPTTRRTVYTLYDHGGALPWSVAFSPDNAFVAVGWSDGTVRFYWAADGTPMARFQAHPAGVTRLAFTQDGRLMVSLGAEDTLRLWGVVGD